MAAAAAGIRLQALGVRAGRRSDSRGLLGMAGADGLPVYGGPTDMQLQVRIAAQTATPERLRALVRDAVGHSPVRSAVQTATTLALQIDVDAT